MLNHLGISKLNHTSYSQLWQRRAELSRTPAQSGGWSWAGSRGRRQSRHLLAMARGEFSAVLCVTEDRPPHQQLQKDGLRRVFSKLLVGRLKRIEERKIKKHSNLVSRTLEPKAKNSFYLLLIDAINFLIFFFLKPENPRYFFKTLYLTKHRAFIHWSPTGNICCQPSGGRRWLSALPYCRITACLTHTNAKRNSNQILIN